MHEQVLFRELRQAILRSATVHGASQVRAVSLWVGALSHVTESTLRAHWGQLIVGTPAEGSRLDLEISEDILDPRAQGVVLRTLVTEGE